MGYPANPGHGPAKGSQPRGEKKPFTKKDGDNWGGNYVTIRQRIREAAAEKRELGELPDLVRPPNKAEIRQLAQDLSPEAIKALAEIAMNPRQNAMARVQAANSILERGYGKAEQPVEHTKPLAEASVEELLAEASRIMGEQGMVIEGQAEPAAEEGDG
jgi:hypothetical protein